MKLLRTDWLRGLTRLAKVRSPQPRRKLRSNRQAIEGLESRVVLAAHVWTNAAGTFLWSDAGNWIGGAPSPTEDNIELYFPNNAHPDAEFGLGSVFNKTISSECDIDFVNPITSLYVVGSLSGDGYDNLLPPTTEGSQTSIAVAEGLDLPFNTDGDGIQVGDHAPDGATLGTVDESGLGLIINGHLGVAAGDFKLGVAEDHLVLIGGSISAFDPTTTTRLMFSGGGEFLPMQNDFDIIEVQDSDLSFAFEGGLGSESDETLVRVFGNSRVSVDYLDTVPATKDFELYGTANASPRLIGGTFEGDITINTAGSLGGFGIMTVGGSLLGDGQLTATGPLWIPDAQLGFTGDVGVVSSLRLGHSESLGSQADSSRVTLFRNASLVLDDSVQLSAQKSLSVGRLTTLVAQGQAAIFGAITALTASRLTVDVAENSELSLTGALNMPRNSVMKRGAGDLRLTQAQSYAGGTQILEGAVLIEDVEALGTGPIAIAPAGELRLGLQGEHELLNAITATAPAASQSIESLSESVIPSARISLADYGDEAHVILATPAGIHLQNQLALSVENPTSLLTIAAPVSGAGGLEKDGPGFLRLTGFEPNTYLGTTRVNAGTLLISDLDGEANPIGDRVELIPGDLVIGDGQGEVESASVLVEGPLAGTVFAAQQDWSIGPDGLFDMVGSGGVTLGSLEMTGGRFLHELPEDAFFSGSTLGTRVSIHPSENPARIDSQLNYSSGHDTEFAIDAEATLLISGQIKGHDADSTEVFRKTGAGTLELGGSSISVTPLLLEEGTVVLNSDSGNALSGPVRIAGGRLEVAQSDQFGTSSSLEILSGGQLVMEAGANTTLDQLDIVRGDVLIGESAALTVTDSVRLYGAEITVEADAELVLDGEQPQVVVDALSIIDGDGSVRLGATGAIFEVLSVNEETPLPAGETERPTLVGEVVLAILTPLVSTSADGMTHDGQLRMSGGGVLELLEDSPFQAGFLVQDGLLEVHGAFPNVPVTVVETGAIGGTGSVRSISVGAGGTIDPGYFAPVGLLPDLELESPILTLTVLDDVRFDGVSIPSESESPSTYLVIDLEDNLDGIALSGAGSDDEPPPLFLDRLEVLGSLSLDSHGTELLIGGDFHEEFDQLAAVIADDLLGDLSAIHPSEPFRVDVFDGLDFGEQAFVVLTPRPVFELPDSGGQYVVTARAIDEQTGVVEIFDEQLGPESEPLFSFVTGLTDDIAIIGSDNDDSVRVIDPSDFLPHLYFDGGAGHNTLRLDDFNGDELLFDQFFVQRGQVDVVYFSDFFDDEPAMELQVFNVHTFDASESIPDEVNFYLTSDDDVVIVTEMSVDLEDTRFRVESNTITTIVDVEFAELYIDADSGDDIVRATAHARSQLLPFHFDGGSGNDLLVGHAGRDLLHGQADDDTLVGGGGADELLGADGNDVLRGQAGNDTLSGGLDRDLIDGGGSSGDVLDEFIPEGLDASDIVLTNSTLTGLGDDRLLGLEAAMLQGSSSHERFDASAFAGPVSIMAGDGDDTVIGTAFFDRLFGEGGHDLIYGHGGNDVLQGNAGDDVLMGEAGQDVVSGGPGNDTVNGQAGDDTVSGGEGDDRINGGSGAFDTLFEIVPDSITLIDGAMSGLGADLLFGIEQAQFLGDDNDNVLDASGYSGKVTLAGGAGNDQLISAQHGGRLIGGDGNDVLVGRAGSDALLGGDGDDSLYGGGGNDLVMGEAGNDVVKGNGGTSNTLSGGDGDDIVIGLDSEIREGFGFSLQGVLNQLLALKRRIG